MWNLHLWIIQHRRSSQPLLKSFWDILFLLFPHTSRLWSTQICPSFTQHKGNRASTRWQACLIQAVLYVDSSLSNKNCIWLLGIRQNYRGNMPGSMPDYQLTSLPWLPVYSSLADLASVALSKTRSVKLVAKGKDVLSFPSLHRDCDAEAVCFSYYRDVKLSFCSCWNSIILTKEVITIWIIFLCLMRLKCKCTSAHNGD